MGVKFFGQYLLERGHVTPAQLLAAVDLQERTNESFGDTAVKLNLLDKPTANRLNELQRVTDKRIGELAMDQGMLTPQSVERILTHQRNNHLYVGQALVKLGHLTDAVLETRLGEFKKDQEAYNPENVVLPNDTPAAECIKASVELTRKLLTRIPQIVTKVGTARWAEQPILKGEIAASLTMNGHVVHDVAILASRAVARRVTVGLLGFAPPNMTDDDALDGFKEFLNVVAGNVTARLAQGGERWDFSPPLEHRSGVAVGPRKALIVALHAPLEQIEIAFLF